MTVAARLRDLVQRSRPGDRLPSSRELVTRFGVSPVTVSRALALLSGEGAVVTRPGAGTFVAPPRSPRVASSRDFSWQTIALGSRVVDDSGMRSLVHDADLGAIPLASGYPHPSLLPTRGLSLAMTRAARRPGAWERPGLAGNPALRRWFAEAIGADLGPDDVLVTSGGQSALSVAMRATSPAGSSVLVESPTYPGVLAVIRGAGLRPVPVPLDDEGVRPELLEEAFARTGARVLYCQPTFQNPTGAVMGAGRREEILGAARAAGAFIVEDDWAGWLSHGVATPPPLVAADGDGRVIHIRSLTKTVSPSVRIGALIARGPVAERLRALRLVDALFVAGPLQEAALDFVSSPAWGRHLASLRANLRQRWEALDASLQRHIPALTPHAPVRGGFYTWVQLPPGYDDGEVAAAAQAAGVLVGAGRPFFAAEPPAAFLRLGYAGPAAMADIEEGVRRLARALEAETPAAKRRP